MLEEGACGTSFVIALALAGCADGPGAPPLDSCLVPSAGSADALEVGAASSADLAGGVPSQFAPLHDGDGMTLIRGGQGANMLGFILRLRAPRRRPASASRRR